VPVSKSEGAALVAELAGLQVVVAVAALRILREGRVRRPLHARPDRDVVHRLGDLLVRRVIGQPAGLGVQEIGPPPPPPRGISV
jgi:hypothetical protein